MNAPSVDVKDMLDSEDSAGAGVGTFGTDLFVSKEPKSPDACITVYDTGGFDPDPHAGRELEYPTVQVRVRGAKGGYVAAYAKMVEVRTAIHGDYETTWNGTRYIYIFAQGDILPLGDDDNDRPILTQNFRLARTPA